ncbi:MAG: transposase, partial [Desulfobulbia bacterium]
LFQRGKGLENFEYMDGHILIAADGTGLFASSKVSCPHCCIKNHKNGSTSYYHQMLGVCVVHPDKRNVIPLCPEIILNRDGCTKNDCERNACKRFLENFRREHPHLKAIILEDGLGSTAPNIRMIEEYSLRYILGAKPGDHQYLFEQMESNKDTVCHEILTDDGQYHQFRFLNEVGINKSHQDLKVNAIEYRHTNSKGKERTFSWVTNIKISKTNALEIVRAGRARWKIENETFNTLKNLGYNLEHNYGHGKKYLSTIFCMLMMLAFLIDQVQECCCGLFSRCKKRVATYSNFWSEMRALFRLVALRNWETFYSIIVGDRFLNSS